MLKEIAHVIFIHVLECLHTLRSKERTLNSEILTLKTIRKHLIETCFCCDYCNYYLKSKSWSQHHGKAVCLAVEL